MRVLCIHTPTVTPPGADTWVHVQVIRALDRATNDVHVACRARVGNVPTPTYLALRDTPDTHLLDVDLGTELGERTGWRRALAVLDAAPAALAIARLVRHVRRHRIHVVHTSDRPRDAVAAVVVGRLTRARSIVHVHVTYNPGWMGRLLRWSLRSCDALVGVSEFVSSTLVDGGQAARRVHTVRNAVDVSRWTPGIGRMAVRDELGLQETSLVVTTICRLFPEKGPGDLIRAVADLADLDVHLLVVGQPLHVEYGEQLRALVRELELDDRVHFLERREDVAAVLAASEVFAMPSHDEPFGLVFCEAMAMALPVVAVADGGTLEVVEHGRTGLLSDHGDHAQLVAHLDRLLRDPELRADMGRAGRQRVEEHFTLGRMAVDMATVYRRVACPDSTEDRATAREHERT